MKISKLVIGVFALAIVLTSCGEAEKAKNTVTDAAKEVKAKATDTNSSAINTATSTVVWKGEMLKMHSHEGTLKVKSGNLETSNGKLVGGTITIDMTSISPTDEAYKDVDGQRKEDLIKHLSSPDFFNTSNNPTASFTITSVDGATATGNLTVRGKTNEEKIQNLSVSNNGNSIKGSLTFDRKKYDVSFDHPMKDFIISNDIVLDIAIEGK